MMRQSAGYTILEVMIFLAVSALLAAAIFPTWTNRQKNVQFSQGVIDLENKINDVINDVSTGYFPSNDFKCFLNGSGKLVINPGIGGPSEQGTRKDCIFLGKVMHFNDADGMNIITIVGKRQGANGDAESLSDADPIAVAPDSASANDIPDLTEKYVLKWGLHVTNIVTLGSPNVGAYAIAATTPMTKGSSVKSVDLLPIDGTFSPTNQSFQAADTVNKANWLSPKINPPGGMVVCISDADNAKRAVILIGGAAGPGKLKTIFDIENIKSNFSGVDPC